MEAGVIGPRMFVALVTAAIVSALLVGPAFTWRLRKKESDDLSGYLSRDRVIWKLEAENRDGAIQILAAEASRARGAPEADVIREAVAEREAAMGTGVGRGIAIPHARLDELTRSLVVLGICREGIEWDAVDAKPAHLVFLVLTPTADESDTQLEIMARIARVFSDPAATRELIDAEDAGEVWECLRRGLLTGK
jgi:mannitol/fructose-specific phosphotransferase system IIA component (Ntr-type)